MITKFPYSPLMEWYRGKHGGNGGLGAMTCGHNLVGDLDELAGVWQVRHNKRRGKFQVLSLPTDSGNPRTPKQQANREKFAAAIREWQAMGSPGNTQARNKFVSKYMRTH